MQKISRRGKHEIFHISTSIQRHIINKSNFTYRIILRVLNNFLKNQKKVLDIGCGVGTLSFYLAKKGNYVLGIDISKNAVNVCKKSAKIFGLRDIKFQRMDFPNEIPRDKFDLIVCSEVLEHLEDDDLALKKIYSLLRPNGIVIISVPSKNAPLYRLGLAKEFDKRVGHLRRYTLSELVNKCQKAKFTILETRKTEGALRNFLFLNPVAGKFVRFIKFFLSDIISLLDWISLRFFGESQVFVVVGRL